MTSFRCRTCCLSFLCLALISFGVRPSLARDLSLQKSDNTSAPTAVQDQNSGDRTSGVSSNDKVSDPLQRPIKPRAEKSTREKASKHYRDWEKEVQLIITPEELSAFRKLGTDLERENFIYHFWGVRDPTPDTEENEYKDEFYRRKAYANEHFSAGMPGEQTDRGRMYILHGKPDSIESHPMGGPYIRSAEEGGGTTTTYPFEIWRYRNLDGIGQEVTIEFVDQCGCGNYRKTLNRSDKDADRTIPNAGATDAEALLGVSKGKRLLDPEGVGQSLFSQNGTRFFERMEQDALLDRPPALRMVDTEVTRIIRANLLHFDVRVDFLKGSSDTALMPITIQVPNRELTFVNKDGVQRGLANIFGRLTTITGTTVQTFEDTVRLDVPSGLMNQAVNSAALYWKALPMKPGRYRLYIVVKDANGDKLGTLSQGIQVPSFAEDKLSASSLILADVLEPVAAAEVGSGDFVLGANKVRPKVQNAGQPLMLKHDQSIGLWMQVYHLALNDTTKRPSANIEYILVNTASSQTLMDKTKRAEQVDVMNDQLTLKEKLPLALLAPGEYKLTVRITDLISGQTIDSAAHFTVE